MKRWQPNRTIEKSYKIIEIEPIHRNNDFLWKEIIEIEPIQRNNINHGTMKNDEKYLLCMVLAGKEFGKVRWMMMFFDKKKRQTTSNQLESRSLKREGCFHWHHRIGREQIIIIRQSLAIYYYYNIGYCHLVSIHPHWPAIGHWPLQSTTTTTIQGEDEQQPIVVLRRHPGDSRQRRCRCQPPPPP